MLQFEPWIKLTLYIANHIVYMNNMYCRIFKLQYLNLTKFIITPLVFFLQECCKIILIKKKKSNWDLLWSNLLFCSIVIEMHLSVKK